jgi:hypothetical protein
MLNKKREENNGKPLDTALLRRITQISEAGPALRVAEDKGTEFPLARE